MVVEDDIELLRVFKNQLETKPYDVFFFDSGKSAIDFYRSLTSNLDLVITDLKMQVKHGESLIFDIKYLSPQQKIAVLSAEHSSLYVPEKFDIRVFEKPTPILDVIKEMLNQ